MPAVGDLGGDGDFDLTAGTSAGTFDDFKNTGNATCPAFALRVGAANPLTGLAVAGFATADLGDLDGSGRPDLVTGNPIAGFQTFVLLPERAPGRQVGPGIALLHVPPRRRRRRQAPRSRTARASAKAMPVSPAAAK